jgi:hypothetical protein
MLLFFTFVPVLTGKYFIKKITEENRQSRLAFTGVNSKLHIQPKESNDK